MTLGRPRTITDEEILAALARAISRVGPARLTLADVAAEAGLAAPSVAQQVAFGPEPLRDGRRGKAGIGRDVGECQPRRPYARDGAGQGREDRLVGNRPGPSDCHPFTL